ncbi:MAG: stalk domain-containing protein [Candidatus Fimenecus sp.]
MKKKAISTLLIFVLSILQIATCFAATAVPMKKNAESKSRSVFAYLRKDAKIKMDDRFFIFYDVNSIRTYPIFYNGTAYLPLRGLANMLDKNIEWEPSNRTVYIGRTLKDSDNETNKLQIGNMPYFATTDLKDYASKDKGMQQVTMQIRTDIRVLYNFEEIELQDVTGMRIYPAIFNGSTYLPIRAVSQLLDKKIDWDRLESIITIKESEVAEPSKNKEPDNDNKNELKDDKKDQIKNDALFKKAAQVELETLNELNKQATDNLLALRKATKSESKIKYAEAITEICNALEAKKFDTDLQKIEKTSDEQKKVKDALNEYAQMLWHYTLIIENISYLAAADQDFSMLAETFFNFAVLTQQKEQEATTLIEGLK